MASDLARSRAYIPLFTIRATVHPFSRLSPTEARQRLGPACFFLPSSLKKSRFRPGELISKVQSYLPCPFAPTSIIDCSLRFFFFPPSRSNLANIGQAETFSWTDSLLTPLPVQFRDWLLLLFYFRLFGGGGEGSLLSSIRILRDLRKFRVGRRVDQNIWF